MNRLNSPILLMLLVFYFISCNQNVDQKKFNSTTLIKTIKLEVPEPSGLTFSNDLKTLWTVSDEDSTVFQINTEGKILKSLKMNGFDLEGICTINDSLFAVIFERTREVAIVDTTGKEIKRFKLDVAGYDNQGLEGIAFNQNNNHFFIIKEKEPCLLMEYDFDFNLLREDTLKFSSDVSGLFYDKSEDLLWVLSDENSSINMIDMQREVQQKLSFNLIQPEGIAINLAEKLLYIVSDRKEELYIFRVE